MPLGKPELLQVNADSSADRCDGHILLPVADPCESVPGPLRPHEQRPHPRTAGGVDLAPLPRHGGDCVYFYNTALRHTTQHDHSSNQQQHDQEATDPDAKFLDELVGRGVDCFGYQVQQRPGRLASCSSERYR